VAAHDFERPAPNHRRDPGIIIVDESLRTIDDARRLVEMRACNAFNIRVSKCGGLLTSRRIGQIATDADWTASLAHRLARVVCSQRPVDTSPRT